DRRGGGARLPAVLSNPDRGDRAARWSGPRALHRERPGRGPSRAYLGGEHTKPDDDFSTTASAVDATEHRSLARQRHLICSRPPLGCYHRGTEGRAMYTTDEHGGTRERRILIVDDHNGVRESLGDLLEAAGFRVARAEGGQRALDF